MFQFSGLEASESSLQAGKMQAKEEASDFIV